MDSWEGGGYPNDNLFCKSVHEGGSCLIYQKFCPRGLSMAPNHNKLLRTNKTTVHKGFIRKLDFFMDFVMQFIFRLKLILKLSHIVGT